MTARRLNVTTRKTPTLTGGDDRPTPACQGNPWPYDVLHDHINGPDFHLAVKQAREMCGRCPLQTSCLGGNRKEQWAQAVLGIDGRKDPQARDSCGTAKGYKHHRANNEKQCEACAKWNREKVARYAAKGLANPKLAALEKGRAVKKVKAQRATEGRIESLRHMDATGEGVSEACRRLGITRNALWKWCAEHGMRETYLSLARRERQQFNQWTKEGAA